MTFSHQTKISSDFEYIWKRRQNLRGCQFTGGYIDQRYGLYELKKKSEKCTRKIIGINKILCLADRWHTSLLKELKIDLNLSFTFISPEDNQYGVKVPDTENWTGLVGMLQKKEADLALALLSFTPSRGEVIDFSIAMGFEDLVLYMAKPKMSISHISFHGVFSGYYWIILLVSVVLISLSFSFLVNLVEENVDQNTECNSFRGLDGIRTGISITYRAFLGLDVYTAKRLKKGIPEMLSMRVCLLTVCLFGMINLNTFYAGLASRLTIENSAMHINSLEDVLKNPGYRLTIMKGTRIESFLSEAKDTAIKKIWKVKEKKIVYNTGALMAENQILHDNRLVYEAPQTFEEVAVNYPCKITKSSKYYARTSYGFGFAKNSSYAKLFNFKLSQYKSYGIKNHLRRDTEIANTLGCKEAEEYWHSLGYSNIFLPFAIIMVGVIFGMISFAVEKFTHLVKQRCIKGTTNRVTSESVLNVDNKHSYRLFNTTNSNCTFPRSM